MGSPTRGWLRLTRAATTTVAGLGLAVGAHKVGGGALPGATGCAVLAAGTFLACWACTFRRLGRISIAVLLGLLQLAAHLGLMAASPPMAPSSAMVMPGHSATGGMSHGHTGAGGWMVLAHVVATALTALVLNHGERAVWSVARMVRRLLRGTGDGSPGRIVVAEPAAWVVRLVRVGHALGGVGRRGPPAPSLP